MRANRRARAPEAELAAHQARLARLETRLVELETAEQPLLREFVRAEARFARAYLRALPGRLRAARPWVVGGRDARPFWRVRRVWQWARRVVQRLTWTWWRLVRLACLRAIGVMPPHTPQANDLVDATAPAQAPTPELCQPSAGLAERPLPSAVVAEVPAARTEATGPHSAAAVFTDAVPLPFRHDVIIFPIIDWSFRFQRPQQLAMQFARAGHRVFYVRTQFEPGNEIRVQPLSERVFQVGLPDASETSIYRDAMSEETTKTILEAFERLRTACHVGDAICMVDLPFWAPAAFALRARFGWRIVYDCMDHHAGFSTNTPAMLEHEAMLSRDSDLVLTTSRPLFEEQSRLNPRCLLVPNAADFDHFRFVPGPVPPELADLPSPIIGYYGAISDWFDGALVRELARRRPAWTFVLIGRTFGADLAPLRDVRNVHLIDEKPYALLPPYLKAFDACIIPFKKTPLTQATNPVKVFEFLSAGKPVVATRLAELEQFEGLIQLATDREEWLGGLGRALDDEDFGRRHARLAFARQHTWHARFEAIRAEVQKQYGKASIIVVTYNNLDYNRLCLESIHRNTSYPHFELIVVDNASTDGTPDMLAQFCEAHPEMDMTVILRDTNEGFARANNIGLKAATGEYIVLLNNDTLVTTGWLGTLIAHLQDPTVGMVGPVTNFSGNESRIEVSYRSLAEMELFARDHVQRHRGQRFAIRMLAFFCVAIRRITVETVGQLDERFGIGMFEDDDYALRVKHAGLQIVCAEDVFIHHWGRASFSALESEKYQRLFEENRRKFEDKWRMPWEPHRSRLSTRRG